MGESDEQHLHYPVRAILVVAVAWLLFAFSVVVYAGISLLLLPALPAIFYGQVCLLSSAHEYARSIAQRGRRSVHRSPRIDGLASPRR